MVGIKNNRRTLYTKQQLKESLIELLHDHDLDKITVTEICNLANINRGTFYAHYANPSELFAEIETDLITKIEPLLGSFNEPLETWLPPILQVIKDQDAATKIMIGNIREYKVFQVMLAPIREKTLQNFQQRFHEDDEHILGYYYEFFFSGAIHVIINWLSSGAKESTQSITKIISNITQQ